MGERIEVAVGDKLFVTSRLDSRGRIEIVDRITPTGRIITKNYQYEPDGWRRGERETWNRTKAVKATEDHLAGINRYSLVRKIEQFRNWEKLGPDDLKAIAEIVAKYQLPGQ